MSNESPEIQRLIKERDDYINSLPPGRREKMQQFQRELELEMGTGDPERAMKVIARRLTNINEQLVDLAKSAKEVLDEQISKNLATDLISRVSKRE